MSDRDLLMTSYTTGGNPVLTVPGSLGTPATTWAHPVSALCEIEYIIHNITAFAETAHCQISITAFADVEDVKTGLSNGPFMRASPPS